jgi:asparagine synthase (glutamine-hydrolysing)
MLKNEEIANQEIDLINQIKKKNLTYLTKNRLVQLIRVCKEVESQKIEGAFIETGCALGGSAILIASLMNKNRSLFVYDVFGMIPPPTKEDPLEVHNRYQIILTGNSSGIGSDNYYGYEDDLYNKVCLNFLSFGIDPKQEKIDLIKGLLQHTMKINFPVAFAHIDVDWYEPVKTSLERIFPFLSPGGYIILDDYNDWGGCKKATDEFLCKIAGQYTLFNNNKGPLCIKKKLITK